MVKLKKVDRYSIKDDGIDSFPPKKNDLKSQIIACRWNMRKSKNLDKLDLAIFLASIPAKTWYSLLTKDEFTTWDNKNEARSSFRLSKKQH